MASNEGAQRAFHLSNLDDAETALLDLAADDRHVLSLSDKEALILRLYDQIQELELEQAVLEQDLENPSDEDVEEQLRVAERELLEAKATYTVRRKAVETVLMTDPILKTVHLRSASPVERALLPLIHRRDLHSLIHENLANAQAATLDTLSNAEVDHLRVTKRNQELVRVLLDLTRQESSWREEVTDATLKAQMEEVEAEHKKNRARWDVIKGVVSAVIVGSGIDWARNDTLRALVLDESD